MTQRRFQPAARWHFPAALERSTVLLQVGLGSLYTPADIRSCCSLTFFCRKASSSLMSISVTTGPVATKIRSMEWMRSSVMLSRLVSMAWM